MLTGPHRIIGKPSTKELDGELGRGWFFKMKYNSSYHLFSSSAFSKRVFF